MLGHWGREEGVGEERGGVSPLDAVILLMVSGEIYSK